MLRRVSEPGLDREDVLARNAFVLQILFARGGFGVEVALLLAAHGDHRGRDTGFVESPRLIQPRFEHRRRRPRILRRAEHHDRVAGV